MSKRKYTKKSEYWSKFNNKNNTINQNQANCTPATADDTYYVSNASVTRSSGSGTTSRRKNRIASSSKNSRYSNIRQGMLPYQVSAEGVDVRDSIELCQKAYANVPIFRNAIDIMAELANSPIYVDGGNDASRNFIEKWFSRINL